MKRDQTQDQIIGEQAAEAWERFHGEPEASSEEHREFAAWMTRSPQNVEAYLRVARTLQTLKAAETRWPDTSAETLIRAARAHAQHALSDVRIGTRALAERPSRGAGLRFAFAMAASVLVIIAASWMVWSRPQTYETGFGEQRFVRLSDGSGITLNTDSKIEVTLSKTHREIRLIEGEALFDVAHDTSRPFDVYTGNSILRAVGTRFDVDVRGDTTTVTIVEGVVSLTHGLDEALPKGNTPLLHVADRVVIDRSGPGAPQRGVRLDEAIAWTQQQLIFNNRPLGDVVAEFNRYNRERIVIDSEELRAQQITGIFRANDPASFVAFLSSIPGVHVSVDNRRDYLVTLDASERSVP